MDINQLQDAIASTKQDISTQQEKLTKAGTQKAELEKKYNYIMDKAGLAPGQKHMMQRYGGRFGAQPKTTQKPQEAIQIQEQLKDNAALCADIRLMINGYQNQLDSYEASLKEIQSYDPPNQGRQHLIKRGYGGQLAR